MLPVKMLMHSKGMALIMSLASASLVETFS